jgi:hypothetical protein
VIKLKNNYEINEEERGCNQSFIPLGNQTKLSARPKSVNKSMYYLQHDKTTNMFPSPTSLRSPRKEQKVHMHTHNIPQTPIKLTAVELNLLGERTLSFEVSSVKGSMLSCNSKWKWDRYKRKEARGRSKSANTYKVLR